MVQCICKFANNMQLTPKCTYHIPGNIGGAKCLPILLQIELLKYRQNHNGESTNLGKRVVSTIARKMYANFILTITISIVKSPN